MGSIIEEDRTVPVAGHGMAVIHTRLCYCGPDRPEVFIIWSPEIRARGWRLVDRPGCIERILRDMGRSRGLDPDAVRVAEALHEDEFATIEVKANRTTGRPVFGSYFQVDRKRVEGWVGGRLEEFGGLPASPVSG